MVRAFVKHSSLLLEVSGILQRKLQTDVAVSTEITPESTMAVAGIFTTLILIKFKDFFSLTC